MKTNTVLLALIISCWLVRASKYTASQLPHTLRTPLIHAPVSPHRVSAFKLLQTMLILADSHSYILAANTYYIYMLAEVP